MSGNVKNKNCTTAFILDFEVYCKIKLYVSDTDLPISQTKLGLKIYYCYIMTH